MRILLTGGTGLIGRELCRKWDTEGHDLIVLSRQPQNVERLCSGARGVASLTELEQDTVLDAVVNLAGAPIVDRPWTQKRRQTLWDSRVDLTRSLVDWLEGLANRPAVLVSGSAVGIYGDRGDTLITESSAISDSDFGSRLCAAWEDEARRAETLDIRVVLIRTAPVLAADGGILSRLKLPFRLGMGGRLGNGQQWMPWIHIDDEVGLIDFLVKRPDCAGAYNACSPQAIQNADFVRSLGNALHRPAIVPAPASLLRLVLGEMSVLLLGGQRLEPARVLACGYQFRFTLLDEALADVFA